MGSRMGGGAGPRAATERSPQANHSSCQRKPAAGRRLLPARHVAHVGQMVGDALVAVDAGLLAGEQEALVRCRRRAGSGA